MPPKPSPRRTVQPSLDFDSRQEPDEAVEEAVVPLVPVPGPFAEKVGGRAARPPTFVARVRPRSLFDAPPEVPTEEPPAPPSVDPAPLPPSAPDANPPTISAGEKGKTRDILEAIRTLHRVEAEKRPATEEERAALARFPGFGPVALSLFPNPATGGYKDAGWQTLGDELQSLLTPDEYASAKRTTFTAYYTSPVVVRAIHAALDRLGVPENALVLEPGCGTGNFFLPGNRYLGVERDALSGRIARALHPDADIRIEDFQDSKLPAVDAVIGNVPFADLRFDHGGQKFSLHDGFLAKSVDALAPGGVLAVVTSHYSLDKQNASAREYLAERADFLGAIRLPSDAFKKEGTAVVTDIVILRKRAPGAQPQHADPGWLGVTSIDIDGATVPINDYFHHHPEMVLGSYSRKDTLYGGGYSVASNGDLAEQLREAIQRLPEGSRLASVQPVRPAFTPPPPVPHLAEGSFFVGDDRRLRQIVDGQPVLVVYGGTELSSFGTMTGTRLAKLVGLRDAARRVLQSQNDGWPADHRAQARKQLNRLYDSFVHAYGPINKTTFSSNADGTLIRRCPNVVKFREDPDALLVMALEEYDETTGVADKAPILKKDVVGPSPPVTSVTTAEDGLLVSLDRKGRVDLAFIAELYGQPDAAVIAELGDLIYRDPATDQWVTADEYLSGNVRIKLAAAEKAGIVRNVEALKAVQPEDVLPGDIDANLGAPWIPVADVQAFAADLFGVPASSITVGHLAKDAVWTVDGDYAAQRSVAVTADYGTQRASGLWLLDLALNQKAPVIYDPDPTDPEKRAVNPDETLAAKEKQKQIKERFKAWVFADPDRTERLVRAYNDTYNALRPRVFDGSHLAFPGMSRGITLNPHQQDAVWRGMAGGNTLLAHCVGAGKTFTMAACAMKMKQAGLIRKPLIAVPNHLLEQFAREFQQLYPNAKLLIAGKDDFTKEKRKHLTAKIAAGDWDAVIVTHSGFERIGMSAQFQERFLREQIAEYDALLRERSAATRPNRNLIKTIEKQKARREARLKELLAADKKDDGLVFDELGVDHLFIDEAHNFKNLETPTKMERVAGVQTGGSERAFDLFMKCRYLHDKHPGHGVTFATGTPVSNTMVELYTMQRYLDPDGLAAAGIDHFDAWAATFGEVVEAMEISPDGKSLRPRSRFAKFVNLPELQQMVRAFADVQTAEMLNLPRPKLEGGKPMIVACPMSDAQARLQDELVARYERIRSQKVDPREDNALAITTDGRKLALDARMLSPAAADFPGSKINALVENVVSVWQKTTGTRGTQMVFCDLGVQPTAWGYSVYDDLVEKLVARGLPADQIACIGEADTDAKKQALFERVRSGSVRVLIGSTAKLGTGTNVQRRLAALHHLDAPWKPAEVEQREGRILRQGNTNAEVAVYRYVTEGSFDSYMWQALETKARFISQVISGETGVRKAEDVGGQELGYAEVKAIASGNPAVLTLAEADAEVQRLSVLRRHHADEQYLARKRVRELPETIARLDRRLASLEADAATVSANDEFTVGGSPMTDPLLARRLNAIPDHLEHTRRFPVGTFRGLAFGLERHPGGGADVYLEGQSVQKSMLSKESQGPRAVTNALNRIARDYADEIAVAERERSLAETQLADYDARSGRPFPHAAYLDELAGLRDRLKIALSKKLADGEPTAAELADRVKALQAAHAADATLPPVPTGRADPARNRRRVDPVVTPVEEPSPDNTEAVSDDPPEWSRDHGRAGGSQRSLF